MGRRAGTKNRPKAVVEAHDEQAYQDGSHGGLGLRKQHREPAQDHGDRHALALRVIEPSFSRNENDNKGCQERSCKMRDGVGIGKDARGAPVVEPCGRDGEAGESLEGCHGADQPKRDGKSDQYLAHTEVFRRAADAPKEDEQHDRLDQVCFDDVERGGGVVGLCEAKEGADPYQYRAHGEPAMLADQQEEGLAPGLVQKPERPHRHHHDEYQLQQPRGDGADGQPDEVEREGGNQDQQPFAHRAYANVSVDEEEKNGERPGHIIARGSRGCGVFLF